jgi:release factor glutamine methyltransferase
MPTVKTLLADAHKQLVREDVLDSKLDARLLLQHASGLTHEQIIADPDFEIASDHAEIFHKLINRRAAHEPVSRILGSREFYGRAFEVSPAVLDPRADTETLITAALSLPRPKRILDLGTGSGILPITLLAEWPEATAVAVDFSRDALAVAERNADRLGVKSRLQLVPSNWFDCVEGHFDLIVSNPPYIPSREIAGLEPDVREHDPHLALDGGDDGLEPYRLIAAGAARHLMPTTHVLVEIGAGQAGDVSAIFAGHGFAAAGQWKDLGGHVRVLAFNIP